MILDEDFKDVYQSYLKWNKIKNSTILVTGATGLIGSLIVRLLNYLNINYNLNIKIIAIVRNKENAINLLHKCEMLLIEGDIRDKVIIEDPVDYIIHCAAITKSKDMINNPVENIQTSVYGTDNILKLAYEKKIKSMVYLSSMEVYGTTSPDRDRITENDLGFIDLQNVRNCYSEGKRICESLCNCYHYQYHIPVKIARLAQTFGAGVNRNDSRIFGQIANNVLCGKDIVLNTDGSSIGNYCYTADSILGIFLLLFEGENGEAYNIVNESLTMSIAQMARLVAKELTNDSIKVILNIDDKINYGYAPPVSMHLSAKKIEKLGWKANYDLIQMYRRMILSYDDKELYND